MDVTPHLETAPQVAPSAFIAPSADLIGAVTIGDQASVWYQAVLRADLNRITVGDRSNIQDGSIIHLASDLGTEVGCDVTCGHRAILHACTIENEVLIGMGATIMDGATIGARSIVGAGALVLKGVQIPSGSLVVGSPARVVRKLDREEQGEIRSWAVKYVEVSRRFISSGKHLPNSG